MAGTTKETPGDRPEPPAFDFSAAYYAMEGSLRDVEVWMSILSDLLNSARFPAGLSRKERLVFEQLDRVSGELQNSVDSLTKTYDAPTDEEDADRVLAQVEEEEAA
jgi:hypothetical protein